jgi:CPA2 family monovalent cation:H+ antiporter-2
VSVLTTLLTPYLIKGSDGAVSRLERLAPRSLMSFLDLYHQWIVQVAAARNEGRNLAIRQIVSKLLFQVTLDMVLITGLFIAAAAMGKMTMEWAQALPEWTGGHRTLLWCLAVIVALPVFVHAFLKLRALATVLAELGVANIASKEHMPRARAVVATMILVAAAAAFVVWVLLIGVTILPPWPMLLTLLAVMAVTVTLMWRRFSQLYAIAQFSLRETLSQPVETGVHEKPLSTLLQDARMESMAIAADSPAAGRLIRELELRSRTGASVVGIDRNGTSIINPGPDDELLVGDKVLIIGTKAHLDKARAALSK